jgi:acetyl esterase/lipase
MKKLKIMLCFLFAAVSVFSQQRIKLWQEHPTFKQKWSELTVFLPEKPDRSGLSVIICPGGSYMYLDMEKEGFSVAEYLNSKGIAAFVLKYRTAWQGNRHPAMIQDLLRAIQMVKENAEVYKINPEKVGVMGFSAGGHLAGLLAVYSDLRMETLCPVQNRNAPYSITPYKPYFSAMIYPVVSMEDSICHKKSRKNLLGKKHSPELAKRMSLEQNIHPDMPPIFLLHCTGDKTVDYRNSVVFDKALTKNGIKHKFLLFDETGHGFGIQPNGKTAGWMEVFLDWLKNL